MCIRDRSGRIVGFHGRLGDLGTIDDKYDIAISTACPRLDDIVVETVECGQQCIDHLRKNKLGYARFILLDKLRPFNMSPIVTPEHVPRLYDLINPSKAILRPAFYSVLRDTLVANDLEQANRVAYGKKRFRVVSLDGKLIDISGTISGGGSSVSRGLMKSKNLHGSQISEQDVINLDSQLAEKEKNYNSAVSTLHEMELALEKLVDRVPEIEMQLSKTQLDLESYSTELETQSQRLKPVSYTHLDVYKRQM